MHDLVEHHGLALQPSFLESIPLEVCEHWCSAACSIMISFHKCCRPAVFHRQLIDVALRMGSQALEAYFIIGLTSAMWNFSFTVPGHPWRFHFRKLRLVVAFLVMLSTCLFHERSEVIVVPRYLINCLKCNAMDPVFKFERILLIWASLGQNQQSECALSEDSDQPGLSAWRKIGSLATHVAHSKDSDQPGRMPRLIWVFAGRILICWFCHVAAHL